MVTRERTYRTSVWVFLAQAVVIYWGLTFLRRAYFLIVEEQWIPIGTTTLVGGTVILLVIVFALAPWYRVRVSATEIRGPSLWGGFHTIPLADGLQLMNTGFTGFRYLKISGKEKGSIWVTLPVTDQGKFMAFLEEYAKKNRAAGSE